MSQPEIFTLNDKEINSIVDILQASGASIENVTELHANNAYDIDFTLLSEKEAFTIMDQLKEKVKIDFAIQKLSENRKKKLLISDMDSTIIEQECIDELADAIGIKEQIASITEKAMQGKLNFESALKERVKLLKDLPEELLEETYQKKISIMGGAKTLVQTMRNNGAFCILVSGGFTFFTEKVAAEVGFNENEANILGIEKNKLNGIVKEPILGKDEKANSLLYHQESLGIKLSDTIAVGDGANDAEMIQKAGLGIAYHAKQTLRDKTLYRIDYCDLSSLLYIQGYKREEITFA